MKKNLIIVLSVLLTTGSIGAHVHSENLLNRVYQDDKTKIKAKELPEPVKKVLDSDAFKNWKIVSAYKLKNGDYEIELKKDETTQVIKFDKEGKIK